MIGVIADDLSGATELGAVGVRCGLRSEIVVAGEPSAQAELVCLDTDSRSCSPADAGKRAAAAAALLVKAGASWIYKKTDSVLRGQVVAELAAIMKQLRLEVTLLVPANPARGRVIREGCYFISGVPIDHTEFARDPEYPRRSARVLEMLGNVSTLPVRVCSPGASLTASGVMVGEAQSGDDLRHWASRRADRMLLAGAAEFFAALLETGEWAMPSVSGAMRTGTSTARELFVCGSTSDTAKEFVHAARQRGTPIFSLPTGTARGTPFTSLEAETIAARAIAALKSNSRVILNIGLPPVAEPALAQQLHVYLTQIAEHVLRKTSVGHIYAEGGATAVALARRMGWNRLTVLRELAPGSATLAVSGQSGLLLTIKPGTYKWPEPLWK